MNVRSLRIGFCALIVALLINCKTQQVVSYDKAQDIKLNQFIKTLKQRQSSFKQIKFDARIKPNLKDPIPNLNGLVYIENKEKIWTNISKFGITGARFLIEPSRLQGFFKLEKKYVDGDFDYFNQLLKVDFLDYQKLQNLLVGRNFAEFNNSDYQLKIEDNLYNVYKSENQSIIDRKQKDEYTETYWFHPDFTLSKVEVFYPNEDVLVEISYSNWIEKEKELLPQNVKLIIKDKNEQSIELEYSKFEFVKMETPYKVPNSYTQKEF